MQGPTFDAGYPDLCLHQLITSPLCCSNPPPKLDMTFQFYTRIPGTRSQELAKPTLLLSHDALPSP